LFQNVLIPEYIQHVQSMYNVFQNVLSSEYVERVPECPPLSREAGEYCGRCVAVFKPLAYVPLFQFSLQRLICPTFHEHAPYIPCDFVTHY
jgi:hypothetical protein